MADDSAFRERMEIAGAVSQMATEWLWDKRSIHAAGQDYEIADPEDEGYRRGYDAEDMETYVLVRRKSDGAVFEIEIERAGIEQMQAPPRQHPAIGTRRLVARRHGLDHWRVAGLGLAQRHPPAGLHGAS